MRKVADRLPADASSLIYIAKCDGFERLHALVPVVEIPPAVWREAVVDGERVGAPEVRAIRDAEVSRWLRRVSLTPAQKRSAETLRSVERLGRGESEVLSMTGSGGRCIVDDRRATRVARDRGLRPVATLLIPVLAWRLGLMKRSEAVRFVRELAVVSGALAEVVLALGEEIERGKP